MRIAESNAHDMAESIGPSEPWRRPHILSALRVLGVADSLLETLVHAEDAAARDGLKSAIDAGLAAADEETGRSAADWITDNALAQPSDLLRSRLDVVGVDARILMMLAYAAVRMTTIRNRDGFSVSALVATGLEWKVDVMAEISPGILWIVRHGDREDVHINRALPMGVTIALPGRPIDAVFRHPIQGVSPQMIDTAVIDGGRTCIRLAPADARRPDVERPQSRRSRVGNARIL